jgi:hypothetical protein
MPSNLVAKSSAVRAACSTSEHHGSEPKGRSWVVSHPDRTNLVFRDFLHDGVHALFAAGDRLRRPSRPAHGGLPGPGRGCSGSAWRTEHSARVQSQNWSMAIGAASGPSHSHDAQFLGSKRCCDRPDANGDVSEERGYAGRSVAYFTIWCGSAEFECPKKFSVVSCSVHQSELSNWRRPGQNIQWLIADLLGPDRCTQCSFANSVVRLANFYPS